MKNRDVETGMTASWLSRRTKWRNQWLTCRALASQLQRAEASHRPVPLASAPAPTEPREKGETERVIRRRRIAEEEAKAEGRL